MPDTEVSKLHDDEVDIALPYYRTRDPESVRDTVTFINDLLADFTAGH